MPARVIGSPIIPAILAAVIFMASGCTSGKEAVLLKNPELKTVKPGYAGNPVQANQFTGPYTSQVGKSFWPIMKWKLSKNPKGATKKSDTRRLTVLEPSLPLKSRDGLMWLGHASFLIQLGGKTVLADPCFSTSPFYKRYVKAPAIAGEINPDYLLVSHVHYDHLDKASLKTLQSENILALLPLKVGSLVGPMNPRLTIQEAGWYQQFATGSDVEIFLLPARHWNRRGPTDMNRFLWGSYVIRHKGFTVYFAGDTGYDSHFKEIGQLFPGIDVALLPIAAYDPRYIMKDNHMNPEEALQAFHDLGAKWCVPMHYGTFDLTDEPVGEPLERFLSAVEAQGLQERVRVLDVGEWMDFPLP